MPTANCSDWFWPAVSKPPDARWWIAYGSLENLPGYPHGCLLVVVPAIKLFCLTKQVGSSSFWAALWKKYLFIFMACSMRRGNNQPAGWSCDEIQWGVGWACLRSFLAFSALRPTQLIWHTGAVMVVQLERLRGLPQVVLQQQSRNGERRRGWSFSTFGFCWL